MGFFDKLKSAAQSITGGAAKVYVECEQVTPGMPAKVWVRAQAESDLKINSVYLLVRAREYAELRDVDYQDGRTRSEVVRGSEQTYDTRIEIAGGQQLEAGQEYTWEGELTLPAEVNPTFRGRIISHTWEIQAGLDAFGNDPDSGWKEIQVR